MLSTIRVSIIIPVLSSKDQVRSGRDFSTSSCSRFGNPSIGSRLDGITNDSKAHVLFSDLSIAISHELWWRKRLYICSLESEPDVYSVSGRKSK